MSEALEQAAANMMGDLKRSAKTYLAAKMMYTDLEVAVEEVYENGHLEELVARALTAETIDDLRDWLKTILTGTEKSLAYLARQESIDMETRADERRIMGEW